MSASPLNLSFSNIAGQPNPTGQVVSVTNNGHSPLNWHVTATPFPSFTWLAATPAGGTVAPGQSEQVTVQVNTSQLTPGSYAGQVVLNGMDAKGNPAPGNPQTIAVNLVIQPPCTLSPPSSSALSFSAVQGAAVSPTSQNVLLTGTGSCVWPLTWKTSMSPAASWLTLLTSGPITGNGQSSSISVTTNTAGLTAGTYSATVTISASDSSNVVVQGGTQTFTVTLTVLPPCVLMPPAPSTLAITLAQGQATSSALTVALSERGTCARPVTWQASSNSAWLTLVASTGTGTLGVNASAATLSPGSYSGTITITATDNSGTSVGNIRTVTVTLTVTGLSISGSVLACPIANCATPVALAGATVTITSGTTTVATTTADASGNYSFSNIPSGSYTITAAGFDGSNIHYTGTLSMALSGNTSNVTINVLPG
jgi:BACON domain-containing protein/carboxypeptidase family protein